MKIRPVEVDSFHADERTDGQTDINDKAKSRFSQCFESA